MRMVMREAPVRSAATHLISGTSLAVPASTHFGLESMPQFTPGRLDTIYICVWYSAVSKAWVWGKWSSLENRAWSAGATPHAALRHFRWTKRPTSNRFPANVLRHDGSLVGGLASTFSASWMNFVVWGGVAAWWCAVGWIGRWKELAQRRSTSEQGIGLIVCRNRPTPLRGLCTKKKSVFCSETQGVQMARHPPGAVPVCMSALDCFQACVKCVEWREECHGVGVKNIMPSSCQSELDRKKIVFGGYDHTGVPIFWYVACHSLPVHCGMGFRKLASHSCTGIAHKTLAFVRVHSWSTRCMHPGC